MNPYDAPKADLRDGLGSGQDPAPALWNPNAAASWCLAFSVVFGAYLHMKNWEALDEPEKASASKKWFVAGICSIVIATMTSLFAMADNSINLLVDLLFLAMLLSWYFVSAKLQATYVESRFGKNYPRKGWLNPILIGVGGIFAFGFVNGILLVARAVLQDPH